MAFDDFQNGINRRDAMKLALGAAAVIGAPAILGRAGIASAQTSFAGEELIAVSWSGNHELSFRDTVVKSFNEKYGTKVETVGGWDQMIAQIVAAPADNPPFDITIADEYTTTTGMAQNVFTKIDRSKFPGNANIYPWFDENRGAAKDYGVPFGTGSLWMLTAKSSGLKPNSWKGFWDEKAIGKTTLDASAFYWDLCIPALLSQAKPGIDEVFGTPAEAELLFKELDKLKVAKWYKDGAELTNLMTQEEATVAMMYSADAFGFIKEYGDDFEAAIPDEGTASYTNWFMKVRGTKHSELSDLFMSYLLEKETQQSFLNASTDFMSLRGLEPPPHWQSYPRDEQALRNTYKLFGIDGWDKFGPNWDAYSVRMKETITRTTEG
ncbi:spermidine/putrescine transport system substrate-binding protein [Pararhizobium capsulatum DSM 1112]|uniref:Spermidine/putrescine transport system substrate-binding protein n=1 Tax=Pararhizobium capsulatum DSM 1112 TaxID=1121113 RepID=A0ABU0BXC3_9HYPH|nr:extracellular solute-binding protein [Pararhizobium capsulatum]MDQ0322906.1 spermidine/putrescine transport system substrate-binding protein [Pararhizobium capsulatum DSM 1112]